MEDENATSSCTNLVTAQQIELSKHHWSELSESIVDGISCEEVKLANVEAFKVLESLPMYGSFFKTFGDQGNLETIGSLEVGEKFAEGAQAELFNVQVNWSNLEWNVDDLEEGVEWVLKVFKEGNLVQELQSQWPEGFFRLRYEVQALYELGNLEPRHDCSCLIMCATLVEDGRFAFLMRKEDGDLRSLIERKMAESDHGCGPFSKELGEEIMYRVALGLDYLHSYDIVHRDLKASNVLVKTSVDEEWLYCRIADFESSIGVVGTGFWRAPEILHACREKNIGKRLELFSRAADIYSYGMTCYEVLTGKVPFEDHALSKNPSLLRDLLINQHLCPEVPDYVEDWARELLHRCWKFYCDGRPSIKEILSILEANSNSKYIQKRVLERLVREEESD